MVTPPPQPCAAESIGVGPIKSYLWAYLIPTYLKFSWVKLEELEDIKSEILV